DHVRNAAACPRTGYHQAGRRGPRSCPGRARAGLPRRITCPAMTSASAAPAPSATMRRATFDRTLLLVVPAAAFMLLVFVYPFLNGLVDSFEPKEGGWLANYSHFFTTDNLWPTIWTTLKLALPATIINVGFAMPIAYKMRVTSRWQRWTTTLLVVPITLGTVLIADGMLTYFGPKGWLSQCLRLTPR